MHRQPHIPPPANLDYTATMPRISERAHAIENIDAIESTTCAYLLALDGEEDIEDLEKRETIASRRYLSPRDSADRNAMNTLEDNIHS